MTDLLARVEAAPSPGIDEPSELALRISSQLEGDEEFTLFASEIELLTEYEKRVLEKTAMKLGWTATIAPGWGKVIYRPALLKSLESQP